VNGLSQNAVKTYTEKEAEMHHQDRVVEETGEARNALESYILETRSKLQDEKDWGPYVTSSSRDSFIENLDKAEMWLSEDGYDAQKSEYVTRLGGLTKVGDPIAARKGEDLARPDRISALKSAIGRYSNWATTKDEKYDHIDEAEKKKVSKAAADIDQWLAQQLSKQDRVPKHDDPVLTVKVLNDKLQELDSIGAPIMNTPKPKPKEEPKKEEPKKEEPKKDETKKDETKKDETKKDETKKDETKKDETKADDNKKEQTKKSDEKAKPNTTESEKHATKKAKTESAKGNKDSNKNSSGQAKNGYFIKSFFSL